MHLHAQLFDEALQALLFDDALCPLRCFLRLLMETLAQVFHFFPQLAIHCLGLSLLRIGLRFFLFQLRFFSLELFNDFLLTHGSSLLVQVKGAVLYSYGRAKYPTFKKRHGNQSATYASNAFTWENGQLTLAKMDELLAITFHRAFPKGCKPTSVTVSKDCANRYFVSMLVEEEIKPLPVVNAQVGLDLGLKSMVILSN